MAVGLIGLLLMFGVAGLGMIGIAAALKHRHWGFVLLIPLMLLGGALLLPLLAMERSPELQEAAAAVPDLPAIPGIPGAPGAPGVPGVRFAAAEVASDAELEAVAGAAPEIDLGEAADEPLFDEQASRPDWIEKPTDWSQTVLTTDPYATVDTCKAFASKQLLGAVADRAEIDVDYLGDHPQKTIAEIEERFVEERYLEKREVSVGEVYLMHTLVGFDEESIAWLQEQGTEWHRAARRKTGVRTIAVGGGGVLAVVALLHGVLRGGKRSS